LLTGESKKPLLKKNATRHVGIVVEKESTFWSSEHSWSAHFHPHMKASRQAVITAIAVLVVGSAAYRWHGVVQAEAHVAQRNRFVPPFSKP
jgi:hypothetical protein